MAASTVAAASLSAAVAGRGSSAPRVSARRGAAGAAAPRCRRGGVVRVAADDVQLDPAMGPEMKSAIDRFVGENKVVLFMKGDRVGTNKRTIGFMPVSKPKHMHTCLKAHRTRGPRQINRPCVAPPPRSAAARARYPRGLVGATTWVERWVWLARVITCGWRGKRTSGVGNSG